MAIIAIDSLRIPSPNIKIIGLCQQENGISMVSYLYQKTMELK